MYSGISLEPFIDEARLGGLCPPLSNHRKAKML
jgi:hypothetical protein